MRPLKMMDLSGDAATQPRPHHYALAHVVLRGLFLENPARFFAAMSDPRGREALIPVIWEMATRRSGGAEPSDYAPKDLAWEEYVISGARVLLARMPEPKGLTEAWFVAMVMRGRARPGPADGKSPSFFTLEKGMQRNVLCAWTHECQLNFGDIPAPTPEGFLEGIRKRISGEEPTTP